MSNKSPIFCKPINSGSMKNSNLILKFCLLVLVILFLKKTYSQSTSWMSNVDHDQLIFMDDIAVLNQHTILAGEVTPDDGLDDLMISGHFNSGGLSWMKRIDLENSHYRVSKIMTIDNEVYVFARDFLEGDGLRESNISIFKIDEQGNINDQFRIGSTRSERVYDVVVEGNNIIILSELSDGNGEIGWFIARMDKSGNIQQVKAYKREDFDYQYSLIKYGNGFLVGGQTVQVEGQRLTTITELDNDFNILSSHSLDIENAFNPGVYDIEVKNGDIHLFAAGGNGSVEVILDNNFNLKETIDVGGGEITDAHYIDGDLYVIKGSTTYLRKSDGSEFEFFLFDDFTQFRSQIYDESSKAFYGTGQGQIDGTTWRYGLRKSFENDPIGCNGGINEYNLMTDVNTTINAINWPEMAVDLIRVSSNLTATDITSSSNISCSETTTSVTESETFNQFKVYPNPTNDNLQVYDVLKMTERLEIIDLNGRKLFTGEKGSNSIDVSSIKPGIYFIKIDDKLTKFIKQ